LGVHASYSYTVPSSIKLWGAGGGGGATKTTNNGVITDATSGITTFTTGVSGCVTPGVTTGISGHTNSVGGIPSADSNGLSSFFDVMRIFYMNIRNKFIIRLREMLHLYRFLSLLRSWSSLYTTSSILKISSRRSNRLYGAVMILLTGLSLAAAQCTLLLI